ncbi:hypothetical protein QQY24_07590 [Streptomyces sp. TG1A-8]|uniref:hypothetical protein n=1 Tax=Streptomyces sp. TG1A-8 TaxID=3051385 RepID=UPI00265C5FFC|nr:hypothetical protein [Streptomyces sp. TG1A-8]MDO0925289.1 hypothetical protein [Streptomyces sp. TG1A-8]
MSLLPARRPALAAALCAAALTPTGPAAAAPEPAVAPPAAVPPYQDASLTAGVGSAAHRSLAREAVRASRVLLDNDGGILPLAKSARLFVAGRSADDIGNRSGGWTVGRQGRGPGSPVHPCRAHPRTARTSPPARVAPSPAGGVPKS